MAHRKCRNSVFCIFFLVLFLAGTICGVLLFRLAADRSANWLLAYGRKLQRDGLYLAWGPWVRPLLAAGVLGLVPWGRRVLPWLILLRGLLTAYGVCVAYGCGLSLAPAALRGLILGPAYFLVCLWSYNAAVSSWDAAEFRCVRI